MRQCEWMTVAQTLLLALSPLHPSPSHCVAWFFQGGDHLFLRGEWVVSVLSSVTAAAATERLTRRRFGVAPRRGSSSSSFWHWHLSSQATLCCFLSSLFRKEGGGDCVPFCTPRLSVLHQNLFAAASGTRKGTFSLHCMTEYCANLIEILID